MVGLLSATTVLGTGCGVSKFESLPYVASPTEYELYERFKNSISGDAYTIRAMEHKYQDVVYIDIPSYIKKNVDAKIAAIESALKEDTYDAETMTGIISENEFNYVKCQMDDRKYTKSGVEYSGYSDGVAVVDIKYTGTAKAQAKKNAYTRYIGVNGVFIEDYKCPGKIIRDDKYINKLNESVYKKYISENGETGDFSEQELTNMATEYMNRFSDGHNVEMYNDVFGSSLSQIARMPDISEVLEVSSNDGSFGGYGIYSQGNEIGAGTGNPDYFGDAKSELTLRYVFSCNELRDTCDIQKIIVKGYKLNVELPIEEAVVSDAVNREIKMILDRSDRAILNDDLEALASQRIYDNGRVAMYWGTYNNAAHITKRITSIDNFVGRQTSAGENRYFIIADTYNAERVRGDGEQVGVYNDKYWMLLTLSGQTDEFVISDYVLISRELIKEPENTTTDKYKNLIQALSVDSNITEDTKTKLDGILDELIKNMQAVDTDAITAMVHKVDNVTSDYDLTKVVGQIKSNVLARGKSKKVEVTNAVKNYITGNDVQVEAIIEELIDYNDGYAMSSDVYCMFAKENDEWHIQEIRYIESNKMNDSTQIAQKKQEIASYRAK